MIAEKCANNTFACCTVIPLNIRVAVPIPKGNVGGTPWGLAMATRTHLDRMAHGCIQCRYLFLDRQPLLWHGTNHGVLVICLTSFSYFFIILHKISCNVDLSSFRFTFWQFEKFDHLIFTAFWQIKNIVNFMKRLKRQGLSGRLPCLNFVR